MSFEINQSKIIIEDRIIVVSFFGKQVILQNQDLKINKKQYRELLYLLKFNNYEYLTRLKNKKEKVINLNNAKIKDISNIKKIDIGGIYRTKEGFGTYKNSIFITIAGI